MMTKSTKKKSLKFLTRKKSFRIKQKKHFTDRKEKKAKKFKTKIKFLLC